ALRRPWQISSRELHVTASVGIALAGRTSTPESLLRDSDAAMYRAKQLGGGRVEVFDEVLRLKAERRFATAAALHHALADGQLRVHYQPVVDLSTGLMVSSEALLRWEHPTRGMLSPVEFIPIAEETGLIVSIGAWVLEESCRQLVEWQRIAAPLPGGRQLGIAVNLSVRQLFAADVAGIVRRVLSTTGIRPNDLCLELTESVFMEDVEQFGTTLKCLRDLGVHLAIDDFGTGYSSLSYLQRFPVDAVKIDRSFVDGVDKEVHDRALVAAIIAMAKALELNVIAEGVETRQQLTELKRLGVRQAQGFYLARPMPADDLTVLLAAAHRWDIR
ncbi:MAG: GGDEF domain-containing phosphodiesterase, partial [Ilumatobacteraceae bacterium]